MRDDLKTFDSNWFNGSGVKFKYFGTFTTNFVYMFPYALSFVPKFWIKYYNVYDTSVFNNIPGYPIPTTAYIPFEFQGVLGSDMISVARAYTDRIATNYTYSITSGMRVSIMVFEA
ncbi:hypothetical protein F9K96_05580 [Brucella anthropi]|nr:hypothetical protein F9K96_05580 [Brucella anthropi]